MRMLDQKLFDAATFWGLEHCEIHLRNGANPLATNLAGQTLAHVASSLAVINRAIELGVDVNARDADGRTPLHEAAISIRCDKCIGLIGLGADIEATDHCGKTALDLAVDGNRESVIRLLIAHGADNSRAGKDFSNMSPLWAAVSGGYHCGKTALDLAVDSNRESVIRLLIAYGADNSRAGKDFSNMSPLWAAVSGGYSERVQALIQDCDEDVMKDALARANGKQAYADSIALIQSKMARDAIMHIAKCARAPGTPS